MIGAIIDDKYRIFDHIGEDHLTTSYLARDQSQNEIVVLRFIHPELTPDEGFLGRFRPEAEKLKRLISSQAVKAIDSNQVEAGTYVIFEYVGEKTLADLCQAEGVLPLEQALDIGRQLGLCLVDAHARDLIHRDLRPTNIVIASDGAVKLTNFGVAWGVDLGRLLAEGKLETDVYYAPEQAAGHEIDCRADLYSLGVVLFEMLTGEAPTLAEDLPDGGGRPSRLLSELPPEVDDLVARCLAPEPGDRPQSAAEFLEGINEALRSMALAAEGRTMSIENALAGHTLGNYRLVEKLGRGGMATVYKGYEPALDRYVAIKVLPQHMAGDPEFISRFRREAKAIARLNHPNIVPIFGYGEEGELTFIVMRYVQGGTLKDLMGQPMATEQALKLVHQVARALSYAHNQGVIHRDVKPANVLMAEGNWPLLSDFGLARMMGSSMQLTQTGVGLGTPAYMSPEQGQGLKVDGRSDIYSLGIMLYEMLTGQVPFQADTPMAIVLRHITAPLPMPRQVNPDIPESAERIILRATAKDRTQRYQAADEMIEALERAMAGLPVEAQPPPVPARASMTTPLAPAQESAPALAEAAPPPAPATPVSTPPPPAARKFLLRLLRAVGILLAVLVVVVIALLIVGSVAASNLIEKAVAGANWGEAYPGSQVRFTEKEIEASVAESIRLYLPGSVEDVSLDFVPPDTIEIQGKASGKEMSVECTLTEVEGEINFQLKRLGNTRPFLLGGILSGGVNRGLKTLLEEQSLSVEELKVDANSLTIRYADGEGTSTPSVKRTSTLSLAERPHCGPGETVLFFDDFEDGLDRRWFFHDEDGGPFDPWPVEVKDGNHVLVGTGHNWAVVGNDTWTDYSLHVRVWLSGGSHTHLNVRARDWRDYVYLYDHSARLYGHLIRDHKGQLELEMDKWHDEVSYSWHELTLSEQGKHIEVYLDGKQVSTYDAPEQLPPGPIGLENIRGTVWYDDVLVCGPSR